MSAEDRAKAQRLEIARNLKIYSSGLDYEQTSDFGAQIFTNDFSQDYSDIENFCKENGGLTEQEAYSLTVGMHLMKNILLWLIVVIYRSRQYKTSFRIECTVGH